MSCIHIPEIPFFNNSSFFKDSERVYIHLSTEFPDFVGVLHRHQFIEIVYILSGRAIHTVGDKEYEVKSGDITVINTGVPHKFTSIPNSNESFVTYDLMFTPDFVDSTVINMSRFESLKYSMLFLSLFPSNNISSPDMYIPGKLYADYGEIFTRIYREFGGKEKGYAELIRAYVIELLIKIFRDIEKLGKVTLSSAQLKTIHEAVQYIENHYNLKLSVNDIAAKFFLGPDYFRKLFKKATGESVMCFQRKLRIDTACQLLSTTDMPIKDICSTIGYDDMKTFYNTFKKATGKTPKEYRNHQ